MENSMDLDTFAQALYFVEPDEGFESEVGEEELAEWVDGPQLTAYNAHEPDRLERLSRTLGAAQASVRLMSRRYRRLWVGAVVELHDHKGTLLVTWRDIPSRIMFEGVVLGAWEANGEHLHAHALSK